MMLATIRIFLAFLLLRIARGVTVVSIWVLPKVKGGVE
ncbi:hypothetical protein C7477_106130 [Phyllobacterium leguminum]|uniref:Uncharacterized protein n=1 Tax=Phyllobacterium leguminum TaxID=314237 RepID=A0A318T6V8_9HYPH|nr:hypothetical protein C7477_106130 [Phyllobacterium leguminum]